MNRRQFFVAWIFQNTPISIEVEVMEVFSTSSGPSAFLVHHASEAARNTFAQWLRANNGGRIRCQIRTGKEAEGHIFRVKTCFGRGLVLTDVPLTIRAKDRVSIVQLTIGKPVKGNARHLS